jgi:putative transposase
MEYSTTATLVSPLLLLLARVIDSQALKCLEFSVNENRMLRKRLPKRIVVTQAERERLVKLGSRVGPAVKDLITIVTPRTFARWASGVPLKPRKPGRPRTPEEIRQLVVQIAKDTGWGTGRVLGELRKLGIRKISRSTVSRILKECGFEPGPKRGWGTWHDFVQRHLKTLWACDFFTVKVWTLNGLVEYYVLFFIHVGTRRVNVVGMTPNPNGAWMAEKARKLCEFFDKQGERRPTHIIRDRDGKFTPEFCSILESKGIAFRPTPRRSPNMNPFAETWVRAIKHECLNHFIVFGEQHLRYLIDEYLIHFHNERPHQGLGNRPPNNVDLSSAFLPFDGQRIVCRERLGGLLKHYEREAA